MPCGVPLSACRCTRCNTETGGRGLWGSAEGYREDIDLLALRRPTLASLVAAASAIVAACGDDGYGRPADATTPSTGSPTFSVPSSTARAIGATTPAPDPSVASMSPAPGVARPAPDVPHQGGPAGTHPPAVAHPTSTAPSIAPPTAAPPTIAPHPIVTLPPTPPSTTTTVPRTTTVATPTTTAASTTSTSTTATTTTEPRRDVPRRVVVISDSSGAGMRWVTGVTDALRGAQFTLDLESCRRLVARSCNGREGYVPTTALDALREHAHRDHDTVVIVAGYNDMHHDFNAAFDAIVAEARRQGIDTILWLTYREDVGYQLPAGSRSAYEDMNDALWLRVLSGDYPELEIIDWWRYTEHVSHWLTSDGVHLTRAGAYGMADLISRTLAALDGRPCPVPWERGGAPADPCPSPKSELARRGSVPPVLELYPAPPH